MPRWRQAWTMVQRMAPRWPQSAWPMKSQFLLPTAVGRVGSETGYRPSFI